ncbi:hypothetical protein V8C86DRAFT_511858 [Haematococcus lacustris]
MGDGPMLRMHVDASMAKWAPTSNRFTALASPADALPSPAPDTPSPCALTPPAPSQPAVCTTTTAAPEACPPAVEGLGETQPPGTHSLVQSLSALPMPLLTPTSPLGSSDAADSHLGQAAAALTPAEGTPCSTPQHPALPQHDRQASEDADDLYCMTPPACLPLGHSTEGFQLFRASLPDDDDSNDGCSQAAPSEVLPLALPEEPSRAHCADTSVEAGQAWPLGDEVTPGSSRLPAWPHRQDHAMAAAAAVVAPPSLASPSHPLPSTSPELPFQPSAASQAAPSGPRPRLAKPAFPTTVTNHQQQTTEQPSLVLGSLASSRSRAELEAEVGTLGSDLAAAAAMAAAASSSVPAQQQQHQLTRQVSLRRSRSSQGPGSPSSLSLASSPSFSMANSATCTPLQAPQRSPSDSQDWHLPLPPPGSQTPSMSYPRPRHHATSIEQGKQGLHAAPALADLPAFAGHQADAGTGPSGTLGTTSSTPGTRQLKRKLSGSSDRALMSGSTQMPIRDPPAMRASSPSLSGPTSMPPLPGSRLLLAASTRPQPLHPPEQQSNPALPPPSSAKSPSTLADASASFDLAPAEVGTAPAADPTPTPSCFGNDPDDSQAVQFMQLAGQSSMSQALGSSQLEWSDMSAAVSLPSPSAAGLSTDQAGPWPSGPSPSQLPLRRNLTGPASAAVGLASVNSGPLPPKHLQQQHRLTLLCSNPPDQKQQGGATAASGLPAAHAKQGAGLTAADIRALAAAKAASIMAGSSQPAFALPTHRSPQPASSVPLALSPTVASTSPELAHAPQAPPLNSRATAAAAAASTSSRWLPATSAPSKAAPQSKPECSADASWGNTAGLSDGSEAPASLDASWGNTMGPAGSQSEHSRRRDAKIGNSQEDEQQQQSCTLSQPHPSAPGTASGSGLTPAVSSHPVHFDSWTSSDSEQHLDWERPLQLQASPVPTRQHINPTAVPHPATCAAAHLRANPSRLHVSSSDACHRQLVPAALGATRRSRSVLPEEVQLITPLREINQDPLEEGPLKRGLARMRSSKDKDSHMPGLSHKVGPLEHARLKHAKASLHQPSGISSWAENQVDPRASNTSHLNTSSSSRPFAPEPDQGPLAAATPDAAAAGLRGPHVRPHGHPGPAALSLVQASWPSAQQHHDSTDALLTMQRQGQNGHSHAQASGTATDTAAVEARQRASTSSHTSLATSQQVAHGPERLLPGPRPVLNQHGGTSITSLGHPSAAQPAGGTGAGAPHLSSCSCSPLTANRPRLTAVPALGSVDGMQLPPSAEPQGHKGRGAATAPQPQGHAGQPQGLLPGTGAGSEGSLKDQSSAQQQWQQLVQPTTQLTGVAASGHMPPQSSRQHVSHKQGPPSNQRQHQQGASSHSAPPAIVRHDVPLIDSAVAEPGDSSILAAAFIQQQRNSLAASTGHTAQRRPNPRPTN